MFKKNITTIILTLNEEKNISLCIDSIKSFSNKILVVDSFSTDNTVKIAEKLGAKVIQNRFINHASQFNFGLNQSYVDTEWVLRLDADERLSKETIDEINKNFDNKDINGFIIPFEVNFLGKKLRHGGIYPFSKLILFKKDFGKIENKNMDEHIYLTDGKSYRIKSISFHDDFKNIEDWISKHNKYSSAELIDYLYNKISKSNNHLERRFAIKNYFKNNFYYKLSPIFRSRFYFIYRYYFLLGFLDGLPGYYYHFLQAYWYRLLVDVKLYEFKKNNHE